jgi:hypothetical protein
VASEIAVSAPTTQLVCQIFNVAPARRGLPIQLGLQIPNWHAN